MNHIAKHIAHHHGPHGHHGHEQHAQSLNNLWIQVQDFGGSMINHIDSPVYLASFIGIAIITIVLLDYLGGCMFRAPSMKGSSTGTSGEWTDAAGSILMRCGLAAFMTLMVRFALSSFFDAGHAAVSHIG